MPSDYRGGNRTIDATIRGVIGPITPISDADKEKDEKWPKFCLLLIQSMVDTCLYTFYKTYNLFITIKGSSKRQNNTCIMPLFNNPNNKKMQNFAPKKDLFFKRSTVNGAIFQNLVWKVSIFMGAPKSFSFILRKEWPMRVVKVDFEPHGSF